MKGRSKEASDPRAPVPEGLRCEYASCPLGIDEARPRLSWRLASNRRGAAQSAYRIQVAGTRSGLDREPLWDSGRVSSAESCHIPFDGPPLVSRQRCWWRVKVWDESGRPSAWSAPERWEMGLLRQRDWRASWIGADDEPATEEGLRPAVYLRRELAVSGRIGQARLYVTCCGLYGVELNGRKVGEAVLTPGWTSYHRRLEYQTYDVTELLTEGSNAIGACLGDGWFRGRLGFGDVRHQYGDRLALLLQLELQYEDGRQEVVESDESWRWSTGPILFSDLYDGERYDARREMPGWSRAGFEEAGWRGVAVVEPEVGGLVAPIAPPVRRIRELVPVRFLAAPSGEVVADLGQNMVGRVRLRVRGEAGTRVRLRHGELLDGEGNLYTDNLRRARQEVEYVLSGKGEEVYEPHFTLQGFRYVAVDGFPGALGPESLTGVVLHSDLPITGRFEASDEGLTRLQSNILWSQRGNFVEVPTDCPQRDERLGWTGDAQVFAETAAYNMEVAPFFRRWLRDLAADQLADGRVPWVVPNVLGEEASGAAAWSDAVVLLPWLVWRWYGDLRVLEESYPAMQAWMGWAEKRIGEDSVWRGGARFGDWLEPRPNHDPSPEGSTSKDLIATAYFAHSSDLMARISDLLGLPEGARRYRSSFERVRQAFQRTFVADDGALHFPTQTGYVLALSFDLLPEPTRRIAADRLAADVRDRGGRLATGFLGTPGLLPILARFGYLDEAFALLLRRDYPSWLYAVERDATTVWERWDGILPDGSLQDPGMNSFNHFAFGSVGAFLYGSLAGIAPLDAGFRRCAIHPQPGGGLNWVRASFEAMPGEIRSHWRLQQGRFRLEVSVPVNGSADVLLPRAVLREVEEGGEPIVKRPGVRRAVQEDRGVRLDLESGAYDLSYPWRS